MNCPKCGREMSCGAPHADGDAYQYECHFVWENYSSFGRFLMPDKSAEKARALVGEIGKLIVFNEDPPETRGCCRVVHQLPTVYEGRMIEIISAALTESRNGAIEECAKAVCLGCRRSEVYEDGKHFRNDGLQPKGTNGRWVLCSAKELRALRGNG